MNNPSPHSEHMFNSSALLAQAQEYLRLHREKGRPGAVLVAAWGDFYLIEDNRLREFAGATKLRGGKTWTT